MHGNSLMRGRENSAGSHRQQAHQPERGALVPDLEAPGALSYWFKQVAAHTHIRSESHLTLIFLARGRFFPTRLFAPSFWLFRSTLLVRLTTRGCSSKKFDDSGQNLTR